MKAAEVGDLEADLRRAREENAELRKRLNEVSTLEAAKKKADLRVETYGHVDEANSAIGVALAVGGLDEQATAALAIIQNELFDVGADLSNPLAANPEWEPLRIIQPSIDRLERWCDEFGAELPKLRSFILPGGTLAAAQLHVARTVVRRAERSAWRAVEEYGKNGVSDGLLIPSGTNKMLLSAVEDNAVKVRDLDAGPSGRPEVLLQDARLRWPDTFTQGPDGTVYVTTSHIQDSAFFKPDAPPALPTQLWKLVGGQFWIQGDVDGQA